MTHEFARFVLARYPDGDPAPDDFRLERGPIPRARDGEVVVRHDHLGMAPAARLKITRHLSGAADGSALGSVMHAGAVGVVVDSRHPGFPAGTQTVSVDGGWQTHGVSDGSNLTIIDPQLARPSTWLGALGVSGFTGYAGLEYVGRPQPGDTVVVSAAAGAVGSFVTQMARIRGCRVVGIAGTAAKCERVVREAGASACVSHRSPTLAEDLAEACPDGVDIYFDNVGGRVRDAVWPLLNSFARAIVCGQIAHYGSTDPVPGPDWSDVLAKRVRIQGLWWGSYRDRFDEFVAEASAWIRDDRLRPFEDHVQGFESCPIAFIDLLAGRHTGKVVIDL